MFKIKQQAVINAADQIKILEANPLAASPNPLIGEGTSFDDFDGFTATNFVSIQPFATQFSLAQLRSIRKTAVKADNIAYGTPESPNYSATTNGSQHNPALNRIATSIQVRRASTQTSTMTIVSVPIVGSQVFVRIAFREFDRSGIEYQMGWKQHSIQLFVKTGDTTATLATRISALINQTFSKNKNARLFATPAGNVVTLVCNKPELEFLVVTEDINTGYDVTDLDTTIVTTIPQFAGILDNFWMEKYIQSADGLYRFNNGETDFLPVMGTFYTSYFIKYVTTSTQEHQSGTINAVQEHEQELNIFVDSALTTVITKLDLIGGF